MRDIIMKMKKEMMHSNMKMLLRITLCFKDIGLFEANDKQLLYGNNYSGNHIAIFECELK